MPLNVLTSVPASPVRSKIIFPSAPPTASAPTLGSTAGGTLAATTYYVVFTWVLQTQDGTLYESPASAEASLAVSADYLLTVTAPVPPQMPYAVVGWNVYASETSGTETLQQANIAIGTGWTEPTSGLVSGAPYPTTWGNELIFTYPGRQFPYYNPIWHGHDEFSTAGWQQSITWYVDSITDFEVPYIADGTDASAWQSFLTSAIQRVPFDFYQDSTQGTFISLILTINNPKMEYIYPGLYKLAMKARKVILTQ